RAQNGTDANDKTPAIIFRHDMQPVPPRVSGWFFDCRFAIVDCGLGWYQNNKLKSTDNQQSKGPSIFTNRLMSEKCFSPAQLNLWKNVGRQLRSNFKNGEAVATGDRSTNRNHW